MNSEMDNNPEIIHSLLHADEDIYPHFSEAEKHEELEYIRSHHKELKDNLLEALADSTRTDEAQRYFDRLGFWDDKLDEFYKKYPDLQHET